MLRYRRNRTIKHKWVTVLHRGNIVTLCKVCARRDSDKARRQSCRGRAHD